MAAEVPKARAAYRQAVKDEGEAIRALRRALDQRHRSSLPMTDTQPPKDGQST